MPLILNILQTYVSHNVQITSGVPSKSEDKIKANRSELATQHQGAIPSSKRIQEASLRTDTPQTDNLTHTEKTVNMFLFKSYHRPSNH